MKKTGNGNTETAAGTQAESVTSTESPAGKLETGQQAEEEKSAGGMEVKAEDQGAGQAKPEDNQGPEPGTASGNRKDASRVYIGPGFRGAVPGTVFTNGLTPALEGLVMEFPAAAELVVPVERLAGARRELSDPESALAGIYQAAAEQIRKKGE